MATMREKQPGVWEVRIFTGNDARGRPTQISRTVRGSKRDAQRLAAQLEVGPGSASPAGRRVEDVLDAWIDQNIDTRAPASARDQQSRVRSIKQDKIARIPIAQLSIADVERWHTRLRRAGMQDAGIRNQHGALSAAFGQAVRWGWVRQNLVALAQRKTSKKSAARATTMPHRHRTTRCSCGPAPSCWHYVAARYSSWMVNEQKRGVAVVVGASSKWQSDGRNTVLVHGAAVDDGDLPVGMRWGVGGAIAQRFAAEGFFTVLTTRTAANTAALEQAIRGRRGECLTVELDLVSEESVTSAFARIRTEVGDPTVVVYNAGYIEGRDLPPEMELMENIPTELFDTAMHIASRGPFLVAKEVLPAMRAAGRGTLLFTNNSSSLRGRKRYTGQSLYYPRTIMRALAQALTEEYSEHGVHVANVVVDGLIDSPGTRALPTAQERPEMLIDPVEIADAFFYLHRQHRSVWTHELQLTPHVTKPSF